MATSLSSLPSVSKLSGLGSCSTASRSLGGSNGATVLARVGTKKVATTVKKAATKVASKAPRPAASRKPASGPDRPLWYPGVQAPEWLDGSLPGDYGFDPLGLAKPAEYLQFDLDGLDQNKAKNLAGDVIGKVSKKAQLVDAKNAFQPYDEVFGLTRFRETELIHGRWAMLGVLGAVAVEALTGVHWQDAGKVELVDGASYLGLPLPFDLPTLTIIEVLLIGYIEFARNGVTDPEERIYPGGYFDPLNLASSPEKAAQLKVAELKHGRLAMVSALGFAVQAFATGTGPLDNLAQHLDSPTTNTIFDTLSK